MQDSTLYASIKELCDNTRNAWLVCIDAQNDFVTGALPAQGASDALVSMSLLIECFAPHVVFTMDCHDDNYLDTLEGKHLPITHARQGTFGADIASELQDSITKLDSPHYFYKSCFGSLDLARYFSTIHEPSTIDALVLCGFCTDICVISNALLLKAFLPDVELYVKADACAGTSIRMHEQALDVMKMCQITLL